MAIPSPKFSGLWAISISTRLLMPQIKEVLPGLISSRLSRRPLFARATWKFLVRRYPHYPHADCNHMNRLKYLLTLGALIASISPLMAQQKRVSPHETISKVIDGNRVMIVYGRPYTKDPSTGQNRKIWGELVPYGEVWRTGADEATLLITQKPIMLGGAAIPGGRLHIVDFAK